MKKFLEKISFFLFIGLFSTIFIAFPIADAQGKYQYKVVKHNTNITPEMTQKEFDKLLEEALMAKETEENLKEHHQESLFKNQVVRSLLMPEDTKTFQPLRKIIKSPLHSLPTIELKPLEDEAKKTLKQSNIAIEKTYDKESDETPSLKLSQKTSLVTESAPGTFDVDEDFEKITDDVILMNQLAYAIGKRGTHDGAYDKLIDNLKENFNKKGWSIWTFQGMTGKGNTVLDTPGFIAYNEETNNMTVILRGSQTREDDVGSPDWQVNFDSEHIKSPFGGTVHRGYYNRMLTIMPNITTIMKTLIEGMTDEEKAKLKITVSGHSQGGGLASIALPMIDEMLKATAILGKNFNNAEDHVLRGYLLSSPRVFAEEKSREYIHGTIGKDNIIRQQVIGTFLADPVPLATPGKTLTDLISLIPFKGQELAEKYGSRTGNVSLGYLAGDMSKDTIRRSLTRKIGSFLQERAKKDLQRSLDYIKSSITSPSFHPPLKTAKHFFSDTLMLFKKSALLFLAPLHYGGLYANEVEYGEALFDPNSIGNFGDSSKTLADLLRQGEKFKENERKGLGGAVRTAVETLADAKRSMPSLSGAISGIKQTPRKIGKSFKSAFKKFKNSFW